MKKLISIFLSIMIIGSVLTMGVSADATTNTQKYRGKISNAINSCYDCGEYYIDRTDVGGFLYDFDGNGVKELVLTYFIKVNISGYSVPKLVCSVYTIKNGKTKTILKNKSLYVDAGGPFAAVGVAKKNGKKYLFCYDETGETGGGPSIRRTGEIVLYKIKGTKATKSAKAKFKIKSDTTKSPSKIKSAKIKKNGKKMSYKNFIKWQKTFKLKYAKRYKNHYWKYYYSMKIKNINNII